MSVSKMLVAELAQLCEITVDEIDLDTPFTNYGLDSLRAFDLICALEDEYKIEFTDEVIPQLKTARQMVEYVEKLANC
ncbi:MAG: hypothetical protein COA42_14280 [Alteromonadaceae bacterium]|nr:MAG: hypothetical protein COA42_14280 [Alteromonadaceae bacterium]